MVCAVVVGNLVGVFWVESRYSAAEPRGLRD